VAKKKSATSKANAPKSRAKEFPIKVAGRPTAQNVFEHLRLVMVRLVDLNAKLDVRDSAPPSQKTKLTTSVSIGPADNQPFLLVDGNVVIESLADDDSPSGATVSVHLQAVFGLEGAKAEELEHGADAIAASGMLVMWPHFREIVQSTTSRMGMPAVVLPMFAAASGGTRREAIKIGKSTPGQVRTRRDTKKRMSNPQKSR